MADDDVSCPGIRDHFGGNVTGKGALGLHVAILRTDVDAGAFGGMDGTVKQRGRRTDHHIGTRIAKLRAQHGKLGKARGGAVHFPVACGQFASHALPF